MGVFTESVVPCFGNILATAMLLSPFPAVLRMRQTGELGDVNPLPYPMTCINGAGWVAYGYAIANPYIFPANIIGYLAGLFFSMTAFLCATRKLQNMIATLLIAGSGYFIMLGLISCFGLSRESSQRMWGTSAVVILMCYYVVPLSTMVTIVRTRNAASIYPPLAATAIANGSMWTVYGFAVKDINLWLPNLFGAILGILQLALRLLYGAGSHNNDPVVAARGDEEAAAAFTVVHKASEAPQVEERLDSSSNLLIPGLEYSSGQGGGGGDRGGGGGEPGQRVDGGSTSTTTTTAITATTTTSSGTKSVATVSVCGGATS
ncbi:hypothetical protein Vretimale_9627 [Volvox reticuliferus]|uniref:Bidirectional sugar transporter SWEET n=1 Tax=Volvox reticuliferus TaxID=1737510 RepID=A0A8J4CYN8_9CHLO|nr:hypothetical protein Vretifemale_19224 [Volvox reticuliferus]GIM05174.1 hypothetical protein Vretimale_9627 [Volvox reticuliferus]